MISLGFFRLAVGKSCSFKVGFGIFLVSIGGGKRGKFEEFKIYSVGRKRVEESDCLVECGNLSGFCFLVVEFGGYLLGRIYIRLKV